MKLASTRAAFSMLLIIMLTSCATSAPVAAPTSTPAHSPVSVTPDDPPTDAVVGSELPAELLGYTFFGKPAAEYNVTEVSTSRFEKVRNFDGFRSDFVSWENFHGQEYWGNGDSPSCEGVHEYRPFDSSAFTVRQEDPSCTGAEGGASTPGVTQGGVFKEFIGYQSLLNNPETHMVMPIGATEELAIWTASYENTEQVTEWLMFAGNLTTRKTTLLTRSSDPTLELGITTYSQEPYWATLTEDRVLFVLNTEPSPSDPIWHESEGDHTYSAGYHLTEALFSVRFDGTDLRKELDPYIPAYFSYDRDPETLMHTASHTQYSALKRTDVGEFEEVFSVKWDTKYMPHYSSFVSTSQLRDSTLTISAGKNLVIARDGSDNLTIVRDAADPTNSDGNYSIPPLMVGDHVIWMHYRYDENNSEYSPVAGIYALNLKTNKGFMTVVRDTEARPSEDGKHLELIRNPNHTSTMLQRIFIPLP